jgi:hypothetical protein
MTSPLPGAPARRPPDLEPRRVAVVLWAALAAFPVLFLAMVLAVEGGDDPRAPRHLLFALAAAGSAFGIVLSRLLPPRIPARQTGNRPGANALIRLLVGWSMCEAAAILPLVVHAFAHDQRLLLVFAAALAAQLTLFPTANAWAHLSADHTGSPGSEAGP